jgi:hypothetical protein
MASPLLLAECCESEVLQADDLGLQEPQVHERRATVVLPLDVVDPWTLDVEDRHPAAVRPLDKDVHQLAAPGETEGSEEKVVRLKHAPPPAPAGVPALSPTGGDPRQDRCQLSGEIGGMR